MTVETPRAAAGRSLGRARTRWMVKGASAFAALACVGTTRAHHNAGMFEPPPIWLKGTVVRSEPANPHAWIVVEESTADGRIEQWTVEGPIQSRLDRMGVGRDFLKPGDTVEVCGFALNGYATTRGSGPDPYRTSPRFVHGHMLVLPDGQRRLWGPYGKLNNCFRPDDTVQTWVDFLNADPLAWQAWCTWRTGATPSVTASTAFIDEVRRSLAEPCVETRR